MSMKAAAIRYPIAGRAATTPSPMGKILLRVRRPSPNAARNPCTYNESTAFRRPSRRPS